jgi:hypothetical protein
MAVKKTPALPDYQKAPACPKGRWEFKTPFKRKRKRTVANSSSIAFYYKK